MMAREVMHLRLPNAGVTDGVRRQKHDRCTPTAVALPIQTKPIARFGKPPLPGLTGAGLSARTETDPDLTGAIRAIATVSLVDHLRPIRLLRGERASPVTSPAGPHLIGIFPVKRACVTAPRGGAPTSQATNRERGDKTSHGSRRAPLPTFGPGNRAIAFAAHPDAPQTSPPATIRRSSTPPSLLAQRHGSDHADELDRTKSSCVKPPPWREGGAVTARRRLH